jgi:hypothetical protein
MGPWVVHAVLLLSASHGLDDCLCNTVRSSTFRLAFMQRYYGSTAERAGIWVIEENEVLLGGFTLTI